MPNESLVVTFPAVSTAEGNRLASTLADALRDVDPDIVVDRQRERPDTQDFGATLAVILGTTAATAVAKGIAAWLARNRGGPAGLQQLRTRIKTIHKNRFYDEQRNTRSD